MNLGSKFFLTRATATGLRGGTVIDDFLDRYEDWLSFVFHGLKCFLRYDIFGYFDDVGV